MTEGWFLPERVARINAVVSEVARTEPPGRDVYEAIFADEATMPLQRKREMVSMLQLARSLRPKVIMEIGADKGGGVFHWCHGVQPERMIVCEIEGTPYEDAFRQAFPQIDFLFLPDSSYCPGVRGQVMRWLNGDWIDVLFLDGDKAKFSTDFDSYAPLVRPRGGLVFMHDITDPAPGGAFNECRTSSLVGRSDVLHDPSEGLEAGQRADRGEPSTTAYENWLREWRGRSCGVGVLRIK